MTKYILGIDQGTTGSTVILVNSQGQIVASQSQEFRQFFPKASWVEHNTEDIWNSIRTVTNKLFKSTKISAKQVVAIGITNQRETSVIWNRTTGKQIHNAIVWQCKRTTDRCAELRKKGFSDLVREKTGLVLDPYFSATKFEWLLKNAKDAKMLLKKNQLCAGTIDSYLVYRLTGGLAHVTDVSNASRTMLFNIETGVWDEELHKIFNVPIEIVPMVHDSSKIVGYTQGLDFLPDDIPISGIAGDQQAALFGQTCFNEGEIKCTYGTGSFILFNTGKKLVRSKNGLLTTIAWRIQGEPMQYALEGGAFVCGAAVQWLRDELNLVKSSAEIEVLAKTVKSSDGVYFVPAFSGLGAPYWKPDARALIGGLTRGSSKGNMARAALEGLAHQNVDIMEAMEKDCGKNIKRVRVDGGASENNLLMQLQSDFLGKQVQRPRIIETTSLGAAYLAGLGVGFWKSKKDLIKAWKIEKEFNPEISKPHRKESREAWKRNVNRTI